MQCDTVVITVTPLPVVDAGSDDTLCAGGCDTLGGSPTATGVAPPFNYDWSPGVLLGADSNTANPVFCSTVSGVYQFIVCATDTNGCVQCDTVIVTANAIGGVDAGVDSSICFYGDSIIIGGSPVASGAGPPFIYSWLPDTNLNNDSIDKPTFTPIDTGTTQFIVTVTDTNGCMNSDTVNITVTALPVADAGVDDTICDGFTPTIGGSPTATGTGPFSYLWSPGFNLFTPTDPNPVFIPPDSGIYCFGVIVTDANGCVGPVDSVCIVVNPLPVVNAGNDTSVCDDGTVVVLGDDTTAIGSGPPFTYVWVPNANLDFDSIANPTFTPSGPGIDTFTITVTDTNGCILTDTVIITIDTLPVVDAGVDTSICNDGNAYQLGGLPTASGAGPTFIYDWSPGGLLAGNDSILDNPPFLPPDTGIFQFIVCVTDTNGCVQCDTVVITVTPLPVVDAGSDDTVCVGICDTLGGSPTAIGEGPPFTFVWSQGALLSDPAVANPVFCPTDSGAYQFIVTVTDTNGCIQRDTVLVFVNPLPVVDAGFDSSICFYGDSIILGGSPTATGTGPFSYIWDPDGNLDDSSLAYPTYTPTAPGTTQFIVTVTDSNNCVQSDTVNIIVNALPVVNAGNDASICFGNSTPIGGSPTATGTALPFTYLWDPFAELNDSSLANPLFTPVVPATTQFIVTVTDSNGCVQTDTTNVTVVDSINTNVFVSADASCNDTVGVITISPITGGLPPYLFSLDNFITSQTDTFFDSLAVGSYTVYIKDSLGCENNYSVFVDDPDSIFANILTKNISCNGGNDGVILVDSAFGGTPSYEYSFDTLPFGPNAYDSSLFPGIHSVCIRDVNGCTYCYDTVIIEPSTLGLIIDSTSDVLCFGDTTGSIAVLGIGGTSPYQYSLNPGGPWQSNTIFTNLTSGGFVYVKDTNGCISNTFYNITSPFKLVLDSIEIIKQIKCFGDKTGEVAIFASGGIKPYQFSIINNVDTTFLQPGDTLDSLAAGTYTVIITDSNACVVIDSFKLTQNPATAAVLSKKDVKCFGGDDGEIKIDTVFGFFPPWEFSIEDSNKLFTGTTVFDSLQARVYSLTIRDSIKCEYVYVSIITINEPQPITANITASASVLHKLATGEILLSNVQGGTPLYQYSLDGIIFESYDSIEKNNTYLFTGLAPGDYTVYIRDNNNCRDSFAVTILEVIPYFVPNVFTPNGDGKNEYFVIDSLPPGGTALTIYNRWGNLIYHNDNYENNWDGDRVPDGVYFYFIKWPGNEKQNGWVEIIR